MPLGRCEILVNQWFLSLERGRQVLQHSPCGDATSVPGQEEGFHINFTLIDARFFQALIWMHQVWERTHKTFRGFSISPPTCKHNNMYCENLSKPSIAKWMLQIIQKDSSKHKNTPVSDICSSFSIFLWSFLTTNRRNFVLCVSKSELQLHLSESPFTFELWQQEGHYCWNPRFRQ